MIKAIFKLPLSDDFFIIYDKTRLNQYADSHYYQNVIQFYSTNNDLQEAVGSILPVNNAENFKQFEEKLEKVEKILKMQAKNEKNEIAFNGGIKVAKDKGLVSIDTIGVTKEVMQDMFPHLKDYLSNPNIDILIDPNTLPKSGEQSKGIPSAVLINHSEKTLQAVGTDIFSNFTITDANLKDFLSSLDRAIPNNVKAPNANLEGSKFKVLNSGVGPQTTD